MESAFSAYKSSGDVYKKIGKSKKSKKKDKLKNVIHNNVEKIKQEIKKDKNFTKQLKKNNDNNIVISKKNNDNNIVKPSTSGLQETIKKKNDEPPQNSVQVNGGSDLLTTNSVEFGKMIFEWVLNPFNVDKFIKNNWEKTHIHVKRNDPNYYTKLISIEVIDKMLRQNRIEFTKNLDVTSYENGERNTHNPDGIALAPVVWDFYNNGCSIRLLNPQTFLPNVHSFISSLQEFFQCMTGANVYLTPANSQGFAPHYDDIEAFILQIEGKKRWKLYHPLSVGEILPRFSSRNFNESEIGKPFLDVILEAGDLLYFPRGVIHQACTIDDTHSLHLTLSVYQKNSYGDLFEVLLPEALKSEFNNNIEMRRGLPLNIASHVGQLHKNKNTQERKEFVNKVKEMLHKLVDNISVDNGIDLMQKKFQWDAMPPFLTQEEQKRTIYGIKPEFKNGNVLIPDYIDANTKIRLVRANILRVVQENQKFILYFHTENSKEYHEFDQVSLEIEESDVCLFETLISKYPKYISVENLPIEEMERKINVIRDLFEKGLLSTDTPICC